MRDATPLRTTVLWIFLIQLLTGCSAVRLAYDSADFFLKNHAEAYLGLYDEQLHDWSPTLDTALDRHRAEELPYLAAFVGQVIEDARAGFTRDNLSCLLDQFEMLYRRHFRLAAAAVAPLLAKLDAGQIDQLEATFADEHAEDAAEANATAAARRARKRAERYIDQMRWWFGELDSRQRGLVADVTRQIPDTAPAWYAYRHAKRRALIAMLRRGASAGDVERFLVRWLVDFDDLPQSLRSAQPQLRDAITNLLLQLQPTLSAAQQARFIGRLEGLQRDFLRLQRSPRLAPLHCGD